MNTAPVAKPFPEYKVSYEEIVASLVTLLESLIEHRQRAPKPTGSLAATPFTLDRVAKTPPTIISDPIEAAYRLAFRKLGTMLSERGDDQMEKACDEVWDRMNTDVVAVILNSAWDGIGDWHC